MPGKVTIDDADMRARLRRPLHHAQPGYARRAAPTHSRKLFQDVQPVNTAEVLQKIQELQAHQKPKVRSTLHSQAAVVVPHRPQPSLVLMRPAYSRVTTYAQQSATQQPAVVVSWRHRLWRLPSRRIVLHSLAALVLVVGTSVSWQQIRNNAAAKAQAAQASVARAVDATSTNKQSSAPSTAKVDHDTLLSYQVAPDAARYIRIPKLNVWARVLQVGVTKDNALATPSNVFDTAWYKNSAKPGQPGATLIDGHVSSWTTNGVFYGIKDLSAGDNIEIEKGDGTKLEYTVVKTTTYPADNVDMKSLLQPVAAGQSGLNLITCGGKYDSKAGEFTQRIAVYASLNN